MPVNAIRPRSYQHIIAIMDVTVDDFSWSLPGLNQRQFIALANLLALRSGGQVEPAFVHDRDQDEDELNDNDDASSIDTSQPCQISNSGFNNLRTKFLDCLAELAANETGGRTVARSSMEEDEDGVVIWITRNEGFLSSDYSFFANLSLLLSGLSCNDNGELPSTDTQNIIRETNKEQKKCLVRSCGVLCWHTIGLDMRARISRI